jgi:hypothetical protein
VFVRDSDEYRMTAATLMIEGLAAWAILPRGQSGHRLGQLLRRWRVLVRDADVALVRLSLKGARWARNLRLRSSKPSMIWA